MKYWVVFEMRFFIWFLDVKFINIFFKLIVINFIVLYVVVILDVYIDVLDVLIIWILEMVNIVIFLCLISFFVGVVMYIYICM